MSLQAVVVNYRTSGDLHRFLTTWKKNAPTSDWTLTIVNVSPQPADVEVGEAFVDDRTRHMCFDRNVGYAKACNAGADSVESSAYAFFNADVWFKDDAVQQVLNALDENPRWGVVGPKQMDSRRHITHAGIFGSHAAPVHRGWHQRDRGEYKDVLPAVTVSGAAYFVQGDAWRELTNCEIYQKSVADLGIGPALGAFLPTQHYYEETWCSYHAAAHGWPVMYYGPATVMHEWHQASPVGGHADQEMSRSRTLFRVACDDHEIPRD